MANAKQQSLFRAPRRDTKSWWIVKEHAYGGSLNYRKCARPFDKNKLVHVVLKAHDWASFDQYSDRVESRIKQVASRHRIKLRDLAINRGHIHILISASQRRQFVNFLRQVSAGLGHLIKREFRKMHIVKTEALWIQRPFSRLVSWGRKSVQTIKKYIHRNRQEAMGFIPYQPRRHKLTHFLAQWSRSISMGYSSA